MYKIHENSTVMTHKQRPPFQQRILFDQDPIYKELDSNLQDSVVQYILRTIFLFYLFSLQMYPTE